MAPSLVTITSPGGYGIRMQGLADDLVGDMRAVEVGRINMAYAGGDRTVAYATPILSPSARL